MALPKLESPKYDMTVPSTGQEIKYRPFLVREEKILLLAMEEGTENATHNAVLELVNSCTFGSIGNVTDPMFDVEYAFIKIRSKSVSETIDVRLLCPDDKVTYVEKSIDIDDIQITLDKMDHQSQTYRQHFKSLEDWRDRLISEGQAGIDEFLECYPEADRQKLRNLQRQANRELEFEKSPVASRKIFAYIRSLSE